MSLITRCPACGTMFKVVADQLKISEGWVRCGHCAEIFDATGNLQDEAVPVPAPAPIVPGAAEAASQPAPPDDAPRHEHVRQDPSTASSLRSAPSPTNGASDDFPSSIHSEVSDSAIAGFADSRELDEHARTLRADPLDRPFELRRDDALDDDDDDEEFGPRTQSRRRPPPEPAALDDLSFVRQARRKAFWRRPSIRVVLLFLVLALAALLAVQIAWQDRDRLAAADPALRPWLQKLCEAARCTIGPPRRIEAIAIDSSSFNKLRADTYRLNVTLKNHAATEVAMPALELTLTDSQDQPVLRRVVPAAEFAGRTQVLLPEAEWSTSLALVVNGSAASRIAGYRVLAFYP